MVRGGEVPQPVKVRREGWMVVKCHPAAARHFTTEISVICTWEWSQTAGVRQRGRLRPECRLLVSEKGRDLPLCDREAYCDQKTARPRKKMVVICQCATAQHFATKAPPAWVSEWSRFASVRKRGISRPTERQNTTKSLNATPREILQYDKKPPSRRHVDRDNDREAR